MAVLLLQHAIPFPVAVLRKALQACFPKIAWRAGEDDLGAAVATASLVRPQTIIGRSGDAMMLICVELHERRYTPDNGHLPPGHVVHATVSRPSTSDDALARRVALVVATSLVAGSDEGARLQLAPGETWLDTNDMRALLRSMEDDPELSLRHQLGRLESDDLAPAAAAPPVSGVAQPASRESRSKDRAPRLGSFTLLLDGGVHIDWARIDEAMNIVDPGGNWRSIAAPGGMGFVNGRAKIIVIWSPMPYDAAEIESAMRRSFQFEGDRGRIARHREYITILIDSPADYAAKVATAKATTLMLGLLAQLPQTAAVMNDSVGTIFSPADTHGLVGILHRDEIPIAFWTWTAPDSMVDGNVSLTTGGLLPFLGYEVEMWNSPLSISATAEKMDGVLRYLLINGPVIRHGETIGASAEDRSLRCFFGTSRGARPEPVPVMFVECDIDTPVQPRKDMPPPPSPVRSPPPAALGAPRRSAGFGRKGL